MVRHTKAHRTSQKAGVPGVVNSSVTSAAAMASASPKAPPIVKPG